MFCLSITRTKARLSHLRRHLRAEALREQDADRLRLRIGRDSDPERDGDRPSHLTFAVKGKCQELELRFQVRFPGIDLLMGGGNQGGGWGALHDIVSL